jgi:gliding-associated putative ABC transporter substrate-binding component GldG
MAITERQKKLAITSGAGVLLTGVILLLINVLAAWVPLRLDLTRSHAYSLSKSSRKLARSLEDPVVIKVYFSPDLPSPYNTFGRYVKDLLTEYRSASRGRIRFEFEPSQPAAAFEEHAMQAGLSPLQFEEMGSNQLAIKRGFMGLVMFYRDHSETLPVIKGLDHLEYDLTSRLARMARKNKKVIGNVIGHSEIEWRSSQIKAAQDLPSFYDLERSIPLPPSTTAPVDVDAILIVGPQQKYDEKSLWQIDQAIMHGTPVAFLIDTKRFLAQQFYVMPQSSGLEDLLKTYGVKVGDQLIYDFQCATVGMTQNIGGLAFNTQVRFPYVPMITNVEKNHPLLSGVESIGLPFATRLDTDQLPAGVSFTPLISSSDKSWLAPTNVLSVAPNSIPDPKPGDPHGPFVIGGLLEGSFPSYFAGKTPPFKGATVIPQSPKTSIFILTTSHVLDPNLPEFPGSAALITNALAYLTHDDTLIGIQSKGAIFKPLKPLAPPVRDLIKLLCLLGVPLGPVIWGLLRWRRRQSWRKSVSLQFPSPVRSMGEG